jgi:hypothetical protein
LSSNPNLDPRAYSLGVWKSEHPYHLVVNLTGRVASAERVLSPLDTHKKSSAPPSSLLNTSSFGLANKMVWVGVGVWVKPAGLTQLKSVEYTLRIVLMKLFY